MNKCVIIASLNQYGDNNVDYLHPDILHDL